MQMYLALDDMFYFTFPLTNCTEKSNNLFQCQECGQRQSVGLVCVPESKVHLLFAQRKVLWSSLLVERDAMLSWEKLVPLRISRNGSGYAHWLTLS